MLNIVVLMGKVVKVYTGEDGENYMILAIEKDFTEDDGSFKEEMIKCTLWKGLVDTLLDYYRPGQYVQLSGRLEMRKDGMVVIGEKANFTHRFRRCPIGKE